MNFPPFRPHPLIRGGHAQTVAGVFWPGRLRSYGAVQRRLRLEDGDVIVLHDDQPALWRPGDRAALLVHGLAGCHRSPYMVRVADKLNAVGIRTFRIDLRDCGAGEGLARQPYHAGKSEDVLDSLRELVALCPQSDLSLIGFSLGGNLMLKLLESPDDVPHALRRAAAVNPALDLALCAKAMEGRLARYYDRHLVRLLCQQLERRSRSLPDAPTRQFARAPRALIEFDEWFTAPVAGFESAAHYYSRCSAAQFLGGVKVPTLILTARDDPLVPAQIFDRLDRSAAVTIHIAEGGGHLGYIGRRGVDPDRRWMDWRIVEWVAAELDVLASAGAPEHHARCSFAAFSTNGAPMFRRIRLISACLSLCLVGSTSVAEDDGFAALFPENGKPKGWLVREWNDLAKDAPEGTEWTVKDGVLQPGKRRGTWLVSEKEYTDFILEFEIKLTEIGNSGVALRAPLKGDPAFDGMELQFADLRYNTQAKDSELTGGIYRAIAPSKQVYRPTEWNKCRVELKGTRLKVTLNGEMIQDVDLSKSGKPVKRHDGSDAPAVKDRPGKGQIGFQHLSRNNEPIQIRGARLKEVK